MKNQSSVPTDNYVIKEMCKIADFIGDRIRDRKGDNYLPWCASTTAEAEAKRLSIRSYVYTIYKLNAMKGTVINFGPEHQEFDLGEWNVLPVFADLVIPQSVKVKSASIEFNDLLDRSAFTFPEDIEDGAKPVAQLMTLDEFNAFTTTVQAKFRMDASKVQTFKALRTNQTLTDVIERASCHEKCANRGIYPLELTFQFHTSSFAEFKEDKVREDYIRAKVAENYTI